MRVAAGGDYGRCLEVLGWPLREALLTFIERERERAEAEHRVRLIVWAALRPHQKTPKPPPEPPDLLKDT